MTKHLEEPVEEYEAIPWDALLREEEPRPRTWMMVAAAAIAALALSAGVARALWPSPPVAPVPEADPSALASTTLGPPSGAVEERLPRPLSEADLLAVEPAALERQAAAIAASEVHAMFTREGGDGGGRSFVEMVQVAEVRRLEAARFAVVLSIHTLSDGGEGYRRMGPRAMEVVVDVEGSLVEDLPRPLPAVTVGLAEHDLEASPAPPLVEKAALEAASLWGEPDPSGIEASTDGSVWRSVIPVRDPAGVVWQVAVWTDGEGAVVPAGG